MKICTIIAEFNPLHSGHKKLIDFAKNFADTVVVVLSGNFTQRGLPSVANKYLRAKHAILAGADAVIELPTVFAVSSAENFANAGVKIANTIKSDYLCFGSELGDVTQLLDCAKTLLLSQDDNPTVKKLLKEGKSYPTAIATAFPHYSKILNCPNNVLAIEYLKAIVKNQLNITPITLKRESNYNDEIDKSSKSIRLALQYNRKVNCSFDYVLQDCSLVAEENFKRYVSLAISTMSTDYLKDIEGVTEGLQNRLYKFATIGDYDKLISQLKTKRYTQLKLQRILTNACLGITKQTVKQAKSLPLPLKILAINSTRTDLLSTFAEALQQKNDLVNSLTDFADRIYQTCSPKKDYPTALLKIDIT